MKFFPFLVTSFLALAFCLFFTNRSNAQTIFAISGEKLVSFEASNPGVLIMSKQVTGLVVGHSLMGLDFRPATGQLYALGYNSVLGAAEVYVIDPATAVATRLSNGPVMLNPNIIDVNFDFNPVVDRIRVTASDNSNYRLHPVTGALVATDGNLAYAAADVNVGADPNIVTSAYSNSYIGTPTTTLYNYDATLNVLTTQIPPNNGTLNTIGNVGLNLNFIDQSVDIDIVFNAATSSNTAYLAANTGGSINDALYTINLSTGASNLIGQIGPGIPIRDITVLLERVVPATVTGNLLYAVNTGNNLISFDSELPGIIRTLVAVTGITAGQTISGLDFRPATGELYALGYNSINGETRLYTINTSTGVATPIGVAAITLATGLGKVGMDFNPTVDRIRVTGSNNANYRLHPVTGALAATDISLSFVGVNAGSNPSIGTVAYTNSFNGAGATTLYNYDDSLNVLTTQVPPNNGTLNTIGAAGISINLSDPSADLDIFYNLAAATNVAYLTANVGTQTFDDLYTINLATGMATLVGRVGLGISVTDLAAFIVLAPVETACDDKSIGCARFELLSVRRDVEGDEIYRIRATNSCASPLNYVAFTVPDGIEASSPANAGVYTAPSTRGYAVRSPNFSPFYSIRFKAMGAGIANGQSDIFEYTLPKQADMVYINAFARLADGTGHEVYLNTFNCPTQAFMSSRNESDATDGDEKPIAASSDFLLYPNPSAGQLFIDHSDWGAQEIKLTVMSSTGQYLIQTVLHAGTSVTPLELPVSMVNGLYLLELQAADGTRLTRRFIVQR